MNQLVVILGMHRSGTSLTAGILSQAGYFVADDEDLMKPNPANPDGFFERLSVMELNNKILSEGGGRWDVPPPMESVEALNMADEVGEALRVYESHERSILKDPRMCITFPVWKEQLPEDSRIIRVFRPHHSVTKSLQHRDGFSLQKGLALSQLHNDLADEWAADFPTFRFEYQDYFSPERNERLAELAQFLELDVDLEIIADRLVDPDKRHHSE